MCQMVKWRAIVHLSIVIGTQRGLQCSNVSTSILSLAHAISTVFVEGISPTSHAGDVAMEARGLLARQAMTLVEGGAVTVETSLRLPG